MTPGATALRTSAAVVRPLPRAVYRLTGEKPLAYLHDVLAQEVAGLVPGRGALAVALSPKGRISAEVRVLPLLNGSVLIDAEPDARAGVEERIGRHAGLAGCELEPLDAEVVAVRGPTADEAITTAGLPLPPDHEAAFAEIEGLLVVTVVWGVPGFDLIGRAPGIDALVATAEELDAARIEAGRPVAGRDFDEDVLVNETPLLARAVAAGKGCYPGQESVARVRTLGGVRRLMFSLRATTGELQAGAEVALGADTIGRVTSAAPHPDGGSVAIALLASSTDPGIEVAAGGVIAEVRPLG